MKVVFLAIGKRHDSKLAAAIDDYTARQQRYASTSWQILPSPKAAMSPAEQRTSETRQLLAALKADDVVILLDERGHEYTAPQLAAQLHGYQQRAVGRVVCVIGGAHGVDDSLRVRAQDVWALSKLVFPHQLVRLLLAEQMYRAWTIVYGEPYHHDA